MSRRTGQSGIREKDNAVGTLEIGGVVIPHPLDSIDTQIYNSSPLIGLRLGTLANIFLKSSFFALLARAFK